MAHYAILIARHAQTLAAPFQQPNPANVAWASIEAPLTMQGEPSSASRVTIRFIPASMGSLLELTEQSAYFDGRFEGREEGNQQMLESVEAML